MFDSEVLKIWQAEVERQQNSLQLIASENFASPEVMMLSGSAFTNKYADTSIDLTPRNIPPYTYGEGKNNI